MFCTNTEVHKVISVVNQKGGAGKTTIALNIASAFALEEKRVLVIDSDPQATASDWGASRETAPSFQIIQISKPILHRDMDEIAQGYDVIIIDGPPRSNDVIRSAILAATQIVIPVQPSGADFWATKETVDLVKESSHFRDNQKAAFIISRRIPRTIIGRDVNQALEDFDLPVLKGGTTQRIVYAESMTCGKTVFDIPEAIEAQNEINQLKKEIKEM